MSEPVELPLPMFPLSDLVLPGCSTLLHVFEPRYLRLVDDLRRGQGRLGAVLISHGSEVGGGDRRFRVGTLCRVDEITALRGGGFLAVLAGEERIVVRMWLPDDPYPLALVVQEPQSSDLEVGVERDLEDLETLVRRALWAGIEAGHSVSPATFSLPGPAPYLLYQLTQIAPISILDKQRVLEASDRETAEAILRAALDDVVSLFMRWMDTEDR